LEEDNTEWFFKATDRQWFGGA